MKLILAIISTDDTKACISALNRASYHVTRLATTGGFLSSGNTTLIIGKGDRDHRQRIAEKERSCSDNDFHRYVVFGLLSDRSRSWRCHDLRIEC